MAGKRFKKEPDKFWKIIGFVFILAMYFHICLLHMGLQVALDKVDGLEDRVTRIEVQLEKS